MNLVFVYGTLKEGFRNHPINDGVRVVGPSDGQFETIERFPLYLVGRRRLPWLLDRPGEGHHVVGELYEVDPPALARLDELEQIGRPGWYVRSDILIRPRRRADDTKADATIAAQVYFGVPERLETDEIHTGPIAEYTLEII